MLIGINPNSVSTQPLAPGAENELSTYMPLLRLTIPVDSLTAIVGVFPVIGLLGSSGPVVPVSTLSLIGLLLDPT
jgi:hypothetical protein